MWAAEAIIKKKIVLEYKDRWNMQTTIYKDTIKKGDTMTITKGLNEKYALWTGYGIYDLPVRYIDEKSFKIIYKD